MCRFGMVDNNRCDRYERLDSTIHLQGDCEDSMKIWDSFNRWLENDAPASRCNSEYMDII